MNNFTRFPILLKHPVMLIFSQIWPNAQTYNIHDLFFINYWSDVKANLGSWRTSFWSFYNSNLRHFRIYLKIEGRNKKEKKKLGKMLRRHAAKSFWMDENWVFELAILGVGTLFSSWILLQKKICNVTNTSKIVTKK